MRHPTLIFLCVFTAFMQVSQNIHAEEIWTNYRNSNDIQDVFVDGNFVWCATTSGIVRWDQDNEMPTTLYPTSGLGMPVIFSVKSNNNNVLWFGTNRGIVKYDGATFTAITTADGLNTNTVYTVLPTSEGIWAGTQYGISFFDGISWENIVSIDSVDLGGVSALAKDLDNNLWIKGSKGVYCFNGSSWTHYTMGDDLQGIKVTSIAVDSTGVVWFGARDGGGVFNFDREQWEHYTTTEGLADDTVIDIAAAPDGSIWCGSTSRGVSVFKDSVWTTYDDEEGLPQRWITSFVFDGSNVWMGTMDGLVKFDGSDFQTFIDQRIISNEVHAIAADDSTVWYGTSIGIGYYDGSKWGILDANRNIWEIVVDSENRKWFRDGKNIFILDGNVLSNFKDYYPEVGWRSFASMATDGNRICLGTNNEGIFVFDGPGWTQYTQNDGLVDNACNSVAVKGSVICAGHSNKGISLFDGSSWTSYTTDDGMISNDVSSVFIDNDGEVWVGTWLDGISRFDGASWLNYPWYELDIDDASIAYVSSIVQENSRTLWFGIASGAWKYDKELDTWYSYNTDWTSAITIDAESNKWFATASGIYRLEDDVETLIEEQYEQSQAINIIQNYPNPFNPSTIIRYSLLEETPVTISIFM